MIACIAVGIAYQGYSIEPLTLNNKEMKLYLYPLWLRLWHVINALLFLTLIVTGLNMQSASSELALIRFDYAITWHNISGILITFNYLFFVFKSHFTKNRIHYHIIWKGILSRLFKQIRYYTYGVFKHEPAPFHISEELKFNPLQQVSYVAMMYLILPVVIITGLALMLPELIVDDVYGVGGTLLTALLHSTGGFIASLFLVIHIYFSTMGSTLGAHFKSMVDGWVDAH